MKIMDNRTLCMTSAGLALALVLVTAGGAAAECNPLSATIDRPALIAIAPPESHESNATGLFSRIVLVVTCYQPAQDGSAVQAVVNVKIADGTEQEVFRFAIYPDTAFRTSDSASSQSFGFSLPDDLLDKSSVHLVVRLMPLRGEGKGASMEIGEAKWEATP